MNINKRHREMIHEIIKKFRTVRWFHYEYESRSVLIDKLSIIVEISTKCRQTGILFQQVKIRQVVEFEL